MKFFNFNKKRISCKWLEHGIIFDHANILRVCCAQSHEGEGRYQLKDNYLGEPLDWEEIFKEKNIQREVQKSGNTFKNCKGCILLEEGNWDQENYINRLLLTHWVHCNCECIYCPAIKDEELLSVNRHYNIVPAIKDMIEKGVLKKDSYISIAGGESTIYPEFEELMHTLIDYGIKDICVSTSGIKYSEAIEKGISLGSVSVLVSLDSGTKETHNKIKQVDKFETVIENLNKYSSNKVLKRQVSTKYILIPGINDNEDEINSWLSLNKQLDIPTISMDIEIAWFKQNHENMPEHIINLLKFSKKQAKKMNLDLTFFDRASMVYKKNKQHKWL